MPMTHTLDSLRALGDDDIGDCVAIVVGWRKGIGARGQLPWIDPHGKERMYRPPYAISWDAIVPIWFERVPPVTTLLGVCRIAEKHVPMVTTPRDLCHALILAAQGAA